MKLSEFFSQLRNRESRETDLDAEIQAHLSLETQQRIDRGEAPASARNSARKDFGSVASAKESVRDAIYGTYVANLAADLRYGLRRTIRRPLLSISIAITLAIGVGSLTAILGVAGDILLTPLPYGKPYELHQVWRIPASTGLSGSEVSSAVISDARRLPSAELIEAVTDAEIGLSASASYSAWMTTVVSGGDPERVFGAAVSDTFFETLGVSMLRGRSFAVSDDVGRNAHRVILTHQYWESRFGARERLLGDAILLDGIPYTVTGILPATFRPYLWGVNEESVLFVPIAPQDAGELRPGRSSAMLVRLPAALPVTLAEERLTQLAQSLSFSAKEKPQEWRIVLMPLADEIVAGVRPMLLTLLGVAAGIFLIACVNLTNLTMAQTAARSRELGVRGALGAGRLRVARQILVECLVQSLPGGVLGLVFARAGIELIATLYPKGLPHQDLLGLSPTVAALGLFLSLAGGLAFGILPALRFSGNWMQQSVRHGSSNVGDPAPRSRFLAALVFAEVALVVVVLCCSTLLARSFLALQSLELGFDRTEVLTAQVALPESRYQTGAAQAAFAAELVARFESVPGVEAAAVTNTIPLAFNTLQTSDYSIPHNADLAVQRLQTRTVTPHFFKALGTHILSGSAFTESTSAESDEAVVNETFVRRFFGDTPAVGNSLHQGDRTLRIVGVVRDLRNLRLNREPVPEVYRPFATMPWPLLDIAVRVRTDPAALVPQLRRELSQMDPGLALARTATMQANVDHELARPRFHAAFTGILTAVALLLAAVGIYGVIAYLARLRTAEFGLRLALGAKPKALLALVLRQSLVVPASAALVALPASYLAARSLESQLFGVNATDPLTYATVFAVVLFTCLLAVIFPAIRASRIDPAIALRHE